MANLAVEKYSEYWYYFDRAFSYYGLYEKIYDEDKKGTFRKHFHHLFSITHPRQKEFEGVAGLLFSEILCINTKLSV